MRLEEVVQILTVATFTAGAFSYVVLKPLNKSIEELRLMLAELRADIVANRRAVNDLNSRVAVTENAVKSAHHRIDKLEDWSHGENKHR